MRRLLAGIGLWVAGGLAQAAEPPVIEITDPKDIAFLKRIDAEMTKHLMTMVLETQKCVQAGGEENACLCQQRPRMETLFRLFERAVQEHPSWRGKKVRYREGNMTSTVSFAGLEGARNKLRAACGNAGGNAPLGAAAQARAPSSAIEVTSTEDISVLERISAGMARIASAKQACVRAGREENACLCEQRPRVTGIHQLIARVLAKHPDWRGRQVRYRVGNTQKRISFAAWDAQRRQVEAACAKALPNAFAHMARAPQVDIASLRDPFESYLSVIEAKRQARKKRGRNRPLEPLERFDLSALRLVAIYQQGERRVAMIQDPTGKGYIVKRGNHLGLNNGRIEKITDDTVYIVEEVLNPAGEVVKRTVTMTLREVHD